jgi:hypothetical protein
MISDSSKTLYFEGFDDASEYRVYVALTGEVVDVYQTISKEYEATKTVDGEEKLAVAVKLSEITALTDAEGTFDIYATAIESSTGNESPAAVLEGVEIDFLPLAAPRFIFIE